jgi:translation initiation factor 5
MYVCIYTKMSKLIPVRGLKEIIDPSYRYKMEAINTTQQSGKLVITNLNEVGKSITFNNLDGKNQGKENKPKMIVEYLKKRFGIAIKCDKELTKVFIKGVTQGELQNAVYEFIEYFVICPTCKNPETILSKKKYSVYIKCQACSHHDKVQSPNKIVDKLLDSYLKML